MARNELIPDLDYRINEFYKENTVKPLYVKSILCHDGYDRYGPKAYLHEIYIVRKVEDKYIVDKWCADYRFVEDQSLELYNSKIYTKQKFDEFYNTTLKKKDYDNSIDLSTPAYDLTHLGDGNFEY